MGSAWPTAALGPARKGGPRGSTAWPSRKGRPAQRAQAAWRSRSRPAAQRGPPRGARAFSKKASTVLTKHDLVQVSIQLTR